MRRHIIEEAVRLYHENGGEDGGEQSTTVELICDRADISVRTFFRYFDSKLDVIYLDFGEALRDLESKLAERLEREPPDTALLNASVDHFRGFVAGEVNRDRMIRAMKTPQFAERRAIWRMRSEEKLATMVEGFLAPGPHRSMRARMLASAVRSIVDQAMVAWAHDPDLPFSDLVETGIAGLETLLGSKSG